MTDPSGNFPPRYPRIAGAFAQMWWMPPKASKSGWPFPMTIDFTWAQSR